MSHPLVRSIAGLILIAGASLPAQTAQLVRDLNTAAYPDVPSNPRDFTLVGADVFFVAHTTALGSELYVFRNGTTPPVLVADLVPGEPGSATGLVEFQGRLLFTAQGRNYRTWLMTSDGTPQGTQPFAEAPLMSDKPIVAGNTAFFVHRSPFDDPMLYATAGTAASTFNLARVGPQARIAPPPVVALLGTRLVFSRETSAGIEPWVTDGTPGGTALLADIYPGSSGSTANSSNPRSFVALDSKRVLFVADSATVSGGLWITDGTAAGTSLVADLGRRPSEVAKFKPGVVVGGALYFFEDSPAGTGLWRTDGTPAGTSHLQATPPVPSMVEWGGSLYLSARLAQTAAMSLLRYDLSNNSLTQLATPAYGIRKLWTDGNRVLMEASDYRGAELWESDGTAAGTRLVHDIYPGVAGSNLTEPVVLSPGVTMFSADDGQVGNEVWTSTAGGATSRFANIGPEPGISVGSGAYRLAARAGRVYGATLVSGASQAPEVFATDNSSAGTAIVAQRGAVRSQGEFVELGRRTFFVVVDAQQQEVVYVSEGSPATTRVVYTGPVDHLARLDDAVLVVTRATPSNPGARLLRTDGVSTQEFYRLPTAHAGAQILAIRRIGNRVVFTYFYLGGCGLYATDGTAAGTTYFDASTLQPAIHWMGSMVDLDGEAYCAAQTVAGRPGIVIAGANGLRVLLDVQGQTQGFGTLAQENLDDATAVLGGVLYFPRQDPANNKGATTLWRTDGTRPGTLELAAIPGVNRTHLSQMVAMGSHVYFLAEPPSGIGLWRSDGTTQGTTLVQALDYRIELFRGTALIAAGDRVYFTAFDLAHGAEVWVSDGTANGTQRFLDLVPGRGYGGGANFCLNRGQLLMTASDLAHGKEVFRVDLGAHSHGWGVGCSAGLDLHPRLRSTPPRLGQAMRIEASRLGTSQLGALLLGLPALTPIELGAACTLYVDVTQPHLISVFMPQQGTWTLGLQVPNDPSLHGLDACAQIGVGPSARGPLGLNLSAGLWLAVRR